MIVNIIKVYTEWNESTILIVVPLNKFYEYTNILFV